MQKIIASLAFLKVSSEHLKRDYIENFIPFIATLIMKKQYIFIDPKKICEDFQQEFGLIIPHYPIITILNRAQKRGLIQRKELNFVPVMSQVTKYDFSEIEEEQLRQQEKIIKEFIAFSKEKYNETITFEQANIIFIDYLRFYDMEILFLCKEKSVLPKVKSSKKGRFLFYNFVIDIHKSEPGLFKFITNISIGHILANILLCEDADKLSGRLKGLNLFFDTNFILRLLGTEGEENKDANIELIKILNEEKANLFVFEHTYEEINQILADCLIWIENDSYNPSLASPVLRYFVQNGYTKFMIERFIANLEKTLEYYQIRIKATPDVNEYKLYMIDEEKLYKTIVEVYKTGTPYFEETKKESVLRKDVKSIASIFMLRKNKRPTTLRQADYIFVTTNGSLAYAGRKFELESEPGKFQIPTTLTEVFIGTLVWLQLPHKAIAVNEKKIIADCFAAIQPDELLLKKYLMELDAFSREQHLNKDEFLFLRTHRVALELLQEKSMGDSEAVSSKTIEEIWVELQKKIKDEGERKYVEEKSKHELTQEQLKETLEEKRVIEGHINSIGASVSSLVANTVFILLLFVSIFLAVTQYIEINFLTPFWRAALAVLIVIITAVYGLDFRKVKFTLRTWLQKRIVIILRGK